MARQRVYEIGEVTPLESIVLPAGLEVYLKREDLSTIHAYKWRGAYNRIATLSQEERDRGIVTASAGNHAQGVALAVNRLGLSARIYMPKSAPTMKQSAVRLHGGANVEIILHGDTFDEAAELAHQDVAEQRGIFVHPYDDLHTMAGQGTLGDEIVMAGQGTFDVAFLQIGGGGMAAAVALWLKNYYPNIRIVSVEGEHQASMKAAVEHGELVTLDYLDVFCDGTAVKRAGEKTFPLCRDLIDEFITVTNEEVCAAIQFLWESNRCIPEPSGAMGLAGAMKQQEAHRGKKCIAIIAGANVDFELLGWIASHAGIGAHRRRYLRFHIDERPGTTKALLEAAMDGINIIEFQYGKVHPDKASPVIGFEASPLALDKFDEHLRSLGIEYEDVTSQEDIEFRIIHYEPDLFTHPLFFKLEFPERPGALYDFLNTLQGSANLCYFNYVSTGEQVGRALLGFEFSSEEENHAFRSRLENSPHASTLIAAQVLDRIL